MAPRIIIYQATSEEAGEHNRFLARIHLGTHGFHPVVICGNSAEGTRRKAAEWWETEVAREAAKHAPRGKKSAPEPISTVEDFDVI